MGWVLIVAYSAVVTILSLTKAAACFNIRGTLFCHTDLFTSRDLQGHIEGGM